MPTVHLGVIGAGIRMSVALALFTGSTGSGIPRTPGILIVEGAAHVTVLTASIVSTETLLHLRPRNNETPQVVTSFGVE